MLLILAACGNNDKGGNKSDSGEKVTLNFWTFWGSETRRPLIEKIIDDFNKSQDKIVVKHTFLPWGDIWTKNVAAIAAKNAPDVIVNDINTVPTRAEKNHVEDITQFVEDDKLKKEFLPELFKTVEHKDKVYALPFVTDTRLLFYNKEMFKEAGLDPEKPPTTWAEIEEYSKKLEKKEGDRYTQMGFYPLWGSFGADSWMLNADNGIGYFTDKFDVQIDTENKAQALQWIKDYTNRLGAEAVNMFASEFGSQQANPFISKKVAMIVDVATFYTQLRDYGQELDFGVTAIPEFKKGSGHHSVGGGFVVEIPKGSKHKKEAYEFMKYLTGKEAQTYWAVKNFDAVPNIKAMDQALESKELDEKGKEVFKFTIENLKNTKMTPRPIWGSDINELVGPHIDNVLLNNKNPREELKKAQEKVEKLKK